MPAACRRVAGNRPATASRGSGFGRLGGQALCFVSWLVRGVSSIARRSSRRRGELARASAICRVRFGTLSGRDHPRSCARSRKVASGVRRARSAAHPRQGSRAPRRVRASADGPNGSRTASETARRSHAANGRGGRPPGAGRGDSLSRVWTRLTNSALPSTTPATLGPAAMAPGPPHSVRPLRSGDRRRPDPRPRTRLATAPARCRRRPRPHGHADGRRPGRSTRASRGDEPPGRCGSG